jgi:hypothetical protein
MSIKKKVYTGYGFVIKDYDLVAVPDCDLSTKYNDEEYTVKKSGDFFWEYLLGKLVLESKIELVDAVQIERVKGLFVQVEMESGRWTEWAYGVDEEDCLDELDSKYDLFGGYY